MSKSFKKDKNLKIFIFFKTFSRMGCYSNVFQ